MASNLDWVQNTPVVVILAAFVASLVNPAWLPLALGLTAVVLFLGPLAKTVANSLGLGQSRPKCIYGNNSCKGAGMPSSHAMFVGFLVGYMALYSGFSLTTLLSLLYAVVVMWQRLDSGAHSGAQLVVGFGIGLALGTLLAWTQPRRG